MVVGLHSVLHANAIDWTSKQLFSVFFWRVSIKFAHFFSLVHALAVVHHVVFQIRVEFVGLAMNHVKLAPVLAKIHV